MLAGCATIKCFTIGLKFYTLTRDMKYMILKINGCILIIFQNKTNPNIDTITL